MIVSYSSAGSLVAAAEVQPAALPVAPQSTAGVELDFGWRSHRHRY